MWCSAADTHRKLLDWVVSGARFRTTGVFECDIVHRRSVAVLCMLYKIRCIPDASSLWSSTCAVYASAGFTRCSGHTSVYYSCASSLQNLTVPHYLYSPLSVTVEQSCWTCIQCLTGRFQKQSQWFFIGLSYLIPFCLLLFFPFSTFCLYVGIVGRGVCGLIGCKSLSHSCTADLF